VSILDALDSILNEDLNPGSWLLFQHLFYPQESASYKWSPSHPLTPSLGPGLLPQEPAAPSPLSQHHHLSSRFLPPSMAPVRGHGGRSKAVATIPHATHGYGTHHADFVQRFTEQEARDRAAKEKRPQPLTAEQHAALRTQVKRKRFFKPRRAKATKVNTAGILRKWKR